MVQSTSLLSQAGGGLLTGLDQDCQTTNHTFKLGEEVVYTIYYNWNFIWIPAGEVVFKVEEEGDQWRFKARGYTYPSYEWFYRVNDHYESHVEKNGLRPVYFERDIEEGKFRFFNKLEFDQDAQKVTSYVGKNRNELRQEESFVDQCMYDVLSLVYKTRNINIDQYCEGEHIPIAMFIDHDQYDLSIRYDGRNRKKHIKGQGSFDVIQISPQLIVGNIFSEDEGMTIWVSDDANRLPLMIESAISVGSVKAVIKSWSGLKYPLSANQ